MLALLLLLLVFSSLEGRFGDFQSSFFLSGVVIWLVVLKCFIESELGPSPRCGLLLVEVLLLEALPLLSYHGPTGCSSILIGLTTTVRALVSSARTFDVSDGLPRLPWRVVI